MPARALVPSSLRPVRSRAASAALVGATLLAGVGLASPAAAADTRSLVSGHLSLSAVSGRLPVGATVSVVQRCPRGSALDEVATRTVERQADTALDPHVRLASREFWPAGTVSRYRVTRAVPADEAVPLVTAALCTSTVPATARTVTGRAVTDLRVWGPAPSDLQVLNATVALVSESVESEDVFETAMRAGGVAASTGSLRNAITAVQEVTQEEGIGAVAAVGQTSRRIPRGSFISLRNAYEYTSDLERRITTARP